tara:strand:+ start:1040 stop:1417 length:378 start_codon:yes stop_codon:yes gene_type:complete
MFKNLEIGASAEEAQKFTPRHPNPEIGKEHGFSLMLYGVHSAQYEKAVAAMIKQSRKDEDDDLDAAVKRSAKVIVACCNGWVNESKDAENEKYTPQKLQEMLVKHEFKWLRLECDKFISNGDNFF